MSNDLTTRLRELNTGMWATQPLELCKEAADEIERLRAELHEVAEHLGNALYSDEWRTREYAIVAFNKYERAHPDHERDVDEMVGR